MKQLSMLIAVLLLLPGFVIERYTNGESLIEAYWKSVAWPGQGVFVGELMASPYAEPVQ